MTASCLLVFACSDHSSAPTDPAFAPGGGGPPIRVTATDPAEAEQGTTLVVRVLGSNFEPGAVAEFRLEGVSPGKVHTDSTAYVSPDEIRAHIRIEDEAELGLYDVAVTTPGGKKGVGTEMFQVQEKSGAGPGQADETPLSLTFDTGLTGVRGDGAGPYVDGESGSGVRLRSNGNLNATSGPSRTFSIRVTTSAGTVVLEGHFQADLNTNDVDPSLDLSLGAMPVGASGPTVAAVRIVLDGVERVIRYGRDCSGNRVPEHRVWVTHPDDSTWVLTGDASYLCEWRTRGRPGQIELSANARAPFSATLIKR